MNETTSGAEPSDPLPATRRDRLRASFRRRMRWITRTLPTQAAVHRPWPNGESHGVYREDETEQTEDER